MPTRLLIVEEALKNCSGHWYEYNKAVVLGSRRLGIETILLAHIEVDPKLTEEIGALPFFPVTSWDGVYFHRHAWRRYLGIARHNANIFRLLDRYIRTSGPFDYVFAPTVVIFHLFAWLALARRHLDRGIGRIVLLTRNSSAASLSPDGVPVFKRSTRILGWVLKRLAARRGVCLCTDSARLAEEYCRLAGVEMLTFPHPCELAAGGLPERKSGGEIIFSCLGPGRWEKGTDLLLQAIRLLTERNLARSVRLVIQLSEPIIGPDGSVFETAPYLLQTPEVHVEILRSNLSSAEYAGRLRASHCVVLPYRSRAYYARISGVAVEAMLNGLPVIFTENTWIADAVRTHGAGCGFKNESARDLADTMERLISDYDRIASEASQKRASAERYYSIGNFMEHLLGRSTRDAQTPPDEDGNCFSRLERAGIQ